jgi:hypothetical protein
MAAMYVPPELVRLCRCWAKLLRTGSTAAGSFSLSAGLNWVRQAGRLGFMQPPGTISIGVVIDLRPDR